MNGGPRQLRRLIVKVTVICWAVALIVLLVVGHGEPGLFMRSDAREDKAGWSNPYDGFDSPDPSSPDYISLYVLGVEYEMARPAGDRFIRLFVSTAWVDVLVAAPVLLGIAWLHRSRPISMPDLTCRRCGYDLRATSNRCPECGTARLADRPI